jgi:ArsR family transcriptional regulator
MDSLRRFKADIFQALAHPTRVAVVEALRDGEVGTTALLAMLQIEQANLSQHLAVLRSKQVVVSRKQGNLVYYSLRDPVLTRVLDLLKQYFYAQLSQTRSMLSDLQRSDRPARKARTR